MKLAQRIPTAARVLYGLIFVVFGVNYFVPFLPPQPPPPAEALPFLGGLAASVYLFPLLKATEIFAGALLLAGVAVPFALVLLAPIVVNIAAFHFLLAPGGVGLTLALIAFQVYLAWVHRAAFAPLFRRAPAALGAEPARPGRALTA